MTNFTLGVESREALINRLKHKRSARTFYFKTQDGFKVSVFTDFNDMHYLTNIFYKEDDSKPTYERFSLYGHNNYDWGSVKA